MSECWEPAAIPAGTWQSDGYDTACAKGVCRFGSAVLARAVVGYAVLGVPCDPDFIVPPPTFDPTAVAQRALSGAAVSGTP